MSGAINQFGLHTIEYAIRKKHLEDPLYIATHPEFLPEPRKEKISIQWLSYILFLARNYYAHNTPYDSFTETSPSVRPSIDLAYADQLAKNIWAKPMEDSPSMYKPRDSEWFENPKLRHTLEVNSPYVPYGGYVHPRIQARWEDLTSAPPEISKQKQREKFPVVLSSMTK